MALDFISIHSMSPDYTLVFIIVSQGYLGNFLSVHQSCCLLKIVSHHVAQAGLLHLTLWCWDKRWEPPGLAWHHFNSGILECYLPQPLLHSTLRVCFSVLSCAFLAGEHHSIAAGIGLPTLHLILFPRLHRICRFIAFLLKAKTSSPS